MTTYVPDSTDILGVPIDALTMDSTITIIEDWVQRREKHYVCCCSVHGITQANRDPAYKEVLTNAGLRTPDGMPLVWLLRRAGHQYVERVCGPDLLPALIARSETTGHRHYFYGGSPGVAQELTARLSRRFTGLNLAGAYTPPMRETGTLENDELISKINASRPDIIWIGLGTPKQDIWAANHLDRLDAPVIIAVGAAFDFHAGRIKRAPRWMQRSGLEWLFRLSQDPRRLAKRYLFTYISFLIGITRKSVAPNVMKMRRYLSEIVRFLACALYRLARRPREERVAGDPSRIGTTMRAANYLKLRFRDSPFLAPMYRAKEDVNIVRWVRSGRPLPPPHLVKRQMVLELAEKYSTTVLVETGTYLGQMIEAVKHKFREIYTIEVSTELAYRAKKKFGQFHHIHVITGDSANKLSELVPTLDRPALFWLDGHYSGGITSMGASPTPIMTELEHIASSPTPGHVVLIDDARCFNGTDGYPTLQSVEDWALLNMPTHKFSVVDDLIRLLPLS